MLYLSQVLINGRSREARSDLGDCRALHQRILSAFPDAPDVSAAREHYSMLFRTEPLDGGARVLVQSRERPDWSRLPADYLLPPIVEPKRIDQRYATLAAGQVLVFRLRANPTKRISDGNKAEAERWRGKRVDIRGHDQQIAWLRHKGESAGFALLAARTQPDRSDVLTLSQSDKVTGKHAGHQLTFGSVIFEGRLRVTDPAAFVRALEVGIGSGKAFGFGLLSVARG